MDTFGQQSKWIGTTSDSASKNAPLLRREFTVNSRVESATLKISGLGYYEAWISGRRVGDHVLDPAQTDYGKRVFYVTHDVSDSVQNGINAIGVMLGNGWFNQDRVWGECGLSYGKPRLLAELHIRFADGTDRILGTDESWKWAPGPITDNNIYAGETYDARREQAEWNSPGFDDSGWARTAIVPEPGGRLQRQEMPPIRTVEELQPAEVSEVVPGRYVVDMGQNFAGWARIRVQAPAGAEIRLRFAETLKPDGNVDTASTGVFATGVEQIDSYICRGRGVETWEPRFTYHGFRYVEVTGWPGELDPDDITGVAVHTDLPVAGEFQCSDERLNRLHRMALWTHRSNIHGLPEDCPARERCGWLGDANVVAEYSLWNFSGKDFWEKYLDDIETTRQLNGGYPCNVAPGRRTCGDANPDWAATLIMLPWYLYVQYGDAAVLDKHWEGMRHLIERFGEMSEGWILGGGYGDWFDPGSESICTRTPPTLTTTFWFHRCAGIMRQVAERLERPEMAERYERWNSRIRDAVLARYYSPDDGSFGSQTADAMALQFGLVPEGEESRVVESLVGDIREHDIHLSTGIMGVRYIFEVLTRHGHSELALDLMHRDSYPSFGYLIRRGATTLWESWGEEEHDETHGPRSLNHPMMGGFDNWFYNTLAGIRPDPTHPGFERFLLSPHPIRGLDRVDCYYDCPHGRIVSNWEFEGQSFEWDVEVPEGTTATAELPLSGEVRTLSPGTHRIVDTRP